MSNQKNETENNNTEHSSINFTTTDEAKRIGISTQPKDSKPAPPNRAPNSYFLFLMKFCHRNVTTCYGCGGKFYANGPQRC